MNGWVVVGFSFFFRGGGVSTRIIHTAKRNGCSRAALAPVPIFPLGPPTFPHPHPHPLPGHPESRFFLPGGGWCVCVCESEMARGQQNVNKSYFYHLAINTEFLAPAMLNLWPLFMSEKRKPQTCCHTFCPMPLRFQDPFWPALCIHFICRFVQEKERYTGHIIAIFQLLRPRRSFKEAERKARKPNETE